MVVGDAHRIGTALELLADRCTFQRTKDVRTTGGCLMAITVCSTIGYGGLFALLSDGVPHETIVALAHRIQIGIQMAFFAGSAGDGRTRINAIAQIVQSNHANVAWLTVGIGLAYFWLNDTFGWLAAGMQIIGITTETFGTDTRRPMVAGHAESVCTARQFAAGVNAFTQTATELEANFRILAVVIDLTLSANVAALVGVIGIANVA